MSVLLLLSAVLLSACATGPKEPVDVEIRERFDARYNEVRPQVGTIHSPSRVKGSPPVVVMLHGAGGSRGGMESYARQLAEMGVVVFNADWAADAFAPLEATSDAVCAVAFAYNKAAEWGADPDRIVVVGHSGGGHVGMLAALAPELFTDCNTATDSKVWAYLGIAADPGTAAEGGNGWPLWKDQPEMLASLDAYNHLGSNPQLIVRSVHGTSDSTIDLQRIRDFQEAMAREGYEVELTVIDGAGHAITDEMMVEVSRMIEELIATP